MKSAKLVFGVLISCNMSQSRHRPGVLRLGIPLQEITREFYEPEMTFDFPPIYEELFREDRGLTREPQPLCQEVRTEYSSSVYIPGLQNAEDYTFRPRKILMVNCSRDSTGTDNSGWSDGFCWPHHCREKYVDIDIFGKPKSERENLWQLMMEIPSVPIACECYKMS